MPQRVVDPRSSLAQMVTRRPEVRERALAELLQQLERVLANGLQHEPPHRAAGVNALAEQASPDERRQHLATGAADRTGARTREPPGEHGEAREDRLLAGGEQPIAPVN